MLFQDEHFVAIHKPSGFHVHPPEDPSIRVPRDKICLYEVRNQLGQHVYPVHRLDAGTSGVLLFALSSSSAARLCQLFAERQTYKTYHAVVRGWTPEAGHIDHPLALDSTGNLAEASTSFRRLGKISFPVPVGNRFPTARYSLVEVKPHTGRYHQIRRHMNRITHPLLGDSTHGDSRHNRFFREQTGVEGLCLKAHQLRFQHPWTQKDLLLEASPCEKWDKIQEIFASPSEQA